MVIRHSGRHEVVAERKLRRWQLTETGDVEITDRDLRKRSPAVGNVISTINRLSRTSDALTGTGALPLRSNGNPSQARGPGTMATRLARHAILSETATFDAKTGDLRVVIETPKGSRNKYDYDPGCDCMELGTVLPEGMRFPYDFGFVPSTLGDDGDPLDILVLMDTPVIPGCVIRARPIGAIEAKQKAKGEDWQRTIA
jgi:hypothetical protein